MSHPLHTRASVQRSSVQTALLLTVIGWMATLLGACSDSRHAAVSTVVAGAASTEPPPGAPQAVRVALIMKSLTNPFFEQMERGARRAQQEAGIDLQVRTTPQETATDQQIRLVEDEIRAGTRAIVIAPGHSTRLVPVLKQAQDQGVVVVNIDNPLNEGAMAAAGMKPVPFVGVDNETGAYLAARFVADQIRRPTEAALIEGIRSADNAVQRKRGAERGLRMNPHIRIVAEETAHWKIDEAHSVAAGLFERHPNIGILICANDLMAIGAIKYLRETGRTQVLVAGFDGLNEAMEHLRTRQLAVTVDQQAAEQGYQGVRTALQLLQGRAVPMRTHVATRLVTAPAPGHP